jgi:hypothetical protein
MPQEPPRTPLPDLSQEHRHLLAEFLQAGENFNAFLERTRIDFFDAIAFTAHPDILAWLDHLRSLHIQALRRKALLTLEHLLNNPQTPIEQRRTAGLILRATAPQRPLAAPRSSAEARSPDAPDAQPAPAADEAANPGPAATSAGHLPAAAAAIPDHASAESDSHPSSDPHDADDLDDDDDAVEDLTSQQLQSILTPELMNALDLLEPSPHAAATALPDLALPRPADRSLPTAQIPGRAASPRDLIAAASATPPPANTPARAPPSC